MTKKIEIPIAMAERVNQNEEKEKLLAELIIANKELVFQNQENEKFAAQLLIVNKELVFKNQEKEKLAAELIIANEELKKAKEFQLKHIRDLEEMMFITSHKVRPPIAHILGLSILLSDCGNTQAEMNKMINMMKNSAQSLDSFTRELTAFIHGMRAK